MSTPLISAHGAGLGLDPDGDPLRALEAVTRLGAEYVELDVRRCGDGTLVLSHDRDVPVDGARRSLAELTVAEAEAAVPRLLRYDTALQVLAGRSRAHLDLKFRSPGSVHELAAVQRAVELLGPDGVLVTTGSPGAARAVRSWSQDRHPSLLVGISVGGSVAGRPLPRQLRARRDQLLPGRVLDDSGANALVANHWLGLLTGSRVARRRGLPLAVWTVDHPWLLRHWLAPGRAWLVVTNRPREALALRDGGDAR